MMKSFENLEPLLSQTVKRRSFMATAGIATAAVIIGSNQNGKALEGVPSDILAVKVDHVKDINLSDLKTLVLKKLKAVGYIKNTNYQWDTQDLLNLMHFQYKYQVSAQGQLDEPTLYAVFNGQMGNVVEQFKPLALWSVEEVLGGDIPDNGRDSGEGTYIWIKSLGKYMGIISHQYMRSGRPHVGVDVPVATGHPIYLVGSKVYVWYEEEGAGLVIDQIHPAFPKVLIRSFHCDSAFGQPWTHYRDSGRTSLRNAALFSYLPSEIGLTAIGTVGNTGGSQGSHLHAEVTDNLFSLPLPRDSHRPNRIKLGTNLLQLLLNGADDIRPSMKGPPSYEGSITKHPEELEDASNEV